MNQEEREAIADIFAARRDANLRENETIDHLINVLGKPILEAEKEAIEYEWKPEKIKWDKTEGPKGPYEKSSPEQSENYKDMLKDLEAHKGKLTKDGYFYWLFNDNETVGRKQRTK
jgi:hypothetical protein